jgi:hypothetical protein
MDSTARQHATKKSFYLEEQILGSMQVALRIARWCR